MSGIYISSSVGFMDDTLRSLFYSGYTYFAGKNEAGQYVGSRGYLQDMIAGPYTTAGSYNSLIQSKYNRGFYVTRQMIENHLTAVASGNPNYVPPHGIREWPAHGDPTSGQPTDLAPFRDSDNDGIYEPLDGDYPLIYGDKCMFSISHHGAENPESSHLELQRYVFSFDCADETYRNVVFIKQQYIARNSNLDSLYTGFFVDGDLGNAGDDYAGTHVDLGLVYQYNGDLCDDLFGSVAHGYGYRLPSHGFMVLKGSKLANDGVDNQVGINPGQSVNGYGFADGIEDNEYYGLESSIVFMNQPIPDTITETFIQLRGLFADSTEQVACGTSIPTRMSYTTDSDPMHYATNGVNPGIECSESSIGNPSGDRRFAGATGPTSLQIGDTTEIFMAYVCEFDLTALNNSVLDPVERLIDKCSAIKANFAQNIGPCGNTFGPIQEDLSIDHLVEDPFTVFPNPTNGTFHVFGLTNTCQVSVYDVNGRHLSTVKTSAMENTFSLDPYAGSVFLVKIEDDERMVVKRVVKN